MTLRFVNTSLLVLVLLLTLTGVYGIVWRLDGWAYELHRFSAWGLIALIPWKLLISVRSLRRGLKLNFDRGFVPIVSLVLSVATLLAIIFGLMWAWRVGPTSLWLRETVISWHWILALSLLIPFLLHVWSRWPRPKRSEFLSRRGFLKLAGVSLAGLLGWELSSRLASWRQDARFPRALTGSRLDGYLSGNDFPITTGAGDGRAPLDLETWRLKIFGAVEQPLTLSYDQLLALQSANQIATLDCTIGWYSVQRWRGISLLSLLKLAKADEGAWGVSLRALEGYTHNLPNSELAEVLLATHVGGEVLAHSHGFPLRAVVPARRGWFWVKWLSEVEVLA